MTSARRVLYATDLRPENMDETATVIRIARSLQAEVHVLHVIETLWHFDNPTLEESFYLHHRQRAAGLLENIRRELGNHGISCHLCEVMSGSVTETIIRASQDLQADLIAVGAGNVRVSGTTGITASMVMEQAGCSVFVIRPAEDPTAFRTILCPIDHSRISVRGLKTAIRLAKFSHSELIVMSVIPEVSWLTAAAETGALSGARTEFELQWGEELDRLIAGVDFEGVAHSIEPVKGTAHEQIISMARRRQADLIVMGATGRSGLVRMLLGSTTRRVLRALPCSLLAVRDGEITDAEKGDV